MISFVLFWSVRNLECKTKYYWREPHPPVEIFTDRDLNLTTCLINNAGNEIDNLEPNESVVHFKEMRSDSVSTVALQNTVREHIPLSSTSISDEV